MFRRLAVLDESFEEVVGEESEPVEDRFEVVGEEEHLSVEEPVEVVSVKGFERFDTYVRLYQHASRGYRGYVVKSNGRWFLVAVPGGEPVVEVVFESSEPPANTYIRVLRGSTGFLQGKEGLARRVLFVYEWMLDDLSDLKPPAKYRELESGVLDGLEFASHVFGELYVYHLISAPFIRSSSGVYYIGGSRLALYGDYSKPVARGVTSLAHLMPRTVRYTSTLYSDVRVKHRDSILEVVSSKGYREVGRVSKPVETVGLIKRAPADYAVDPEIAEAVFYYKVVVPVASIDEAEVILLEADLLRRARRFDELRHSVRLVLNTAIDDILRAILRLSTAFARTRGSSSIIEDDVKAAQDKFFTAVDEIAKELGEVAEISTSILYRDVETIIEKHGFEYKGFKCMERSSILRTLASESSRNKYEAEGALERARLTGATFEPRQGIICLLD